MPALLVANILWSQSSGGLKAAVYQVPDVTSADTVDLASVGGGGFKKVTAAVFFGQSQETGTVGAISANTVVTMTQAGMAKDSVLMLVQGTV